MPLLIKVKPKQQLKVYKKYLFEIIYTDNFQSCKYQIYIL